MIRNRKTMKALKKQTSVSRVKILTAVFIGMCMILFYRLYQLQILGGEDYRNNFVMKIKKTRVLKSTRGNIYDRNGNLLAGNKMTYGITMEDNGSYQSEREKQLSLNGTAYQVIQLVHSQKETLTTALAIVLDEKGEYVFNTEGVSLDRFRADVFGRAFIEDMTDMEAAAGADEIVAYLAGEDRFALYEKNGQAYTKEELESSGLPKQLSKKDALEILNIRYMLSLNTFQRYIPVTVAVDVSQDTVSYVLEHKSQWQGVGISDEEIRVYEGGDAFGHILGYTGKISAEELEELQKENENYTSDAVVGKSGIEQSMEQYLQGIEGSETVYVNNMGKVVQKEKPPKDPVPGKDVYLSIDKDLTEAVYRILEQRIAGILTTNIADIKEFDTSKITDSADLVIPVYDVYFALLDNSVVDLTHFGQADATAFEKEIYARLQDKLGRVMQKLNSELKGDGSIYKDLDKEMQEYQDYIVDTLLMEETGLLDAGKIDKENERYQSWKKDGDISLKDFLTEAVAEGWIDMSHIPSKDTYMDSGQSLELLSKTISESLAADEGFLKRLCWYMLQQEEIAPREICLLLYEQGVLSKEDAVYEGLASGNISSYQFVIDKINSLEIKPSWLALDPCSGSAVITDPGTGEVLACVTYPGYDVNRLANQMDEAYYQKLYEDKSVPFYNRATQQLTAPGSTFKPVTAIAGLMEEVIWSDTDVLCDGVFDKVEPPLHCWNLSGHGDIPTVASAIKNSCNDYLCEISYRMGLDGNGKFSDEQSLKRLTSYTKMFGLDRKSGIQLPESEPHITDKFAIPSAIGQGTHNYATVQLARYVNTLANGGSCYDLTLLDKVMDKDGHITEENPPKLRNQIDLPAEVWNDVHTGMEEAAGSNAMLSKLSIKIAGKTGTAEETPSRPTHGLFVGYAPAENPEIAVAVRIAHGFASGNAVGVSQDIFKYYFKLEKKEDILTGTASRASDNAHMD